MADVTHMEPLMSTQNMTTLVSSVLRAPPAAAPASNEKQRTDMGAGTQQGRCQNIPVDDTGYQ